MHQWTTAFLSCIEIIRTGMLALASGNFEVLIFNMFKREGKAEKDFAHPRRIARPQ